MNPLCFTRVGSFSNSKSQRNKQFGVKIYRLCDFKGHTHDMRMYLGKDRKYETGTIQLLMQMWQDLQ